MLLSTYTPSVIYMRKILYKMSFYVFFVKISDQKIEILFWNNSVFCASENVCFKGQKFNMVKSVLRCILGAINLKILIFSIVIFSELTLSISLNPMFYTFYWCSSRFMCSNNAQSFGINIIFLSFSTNQSDNIDNEMNVKFKMMY